MRGTSISSEGKVLYKEQAPRVSCYCNCVCVTADLSCLQCVHQQLEIRSDLLEVGSDLHW